ncbi:MAG: hypothetical protein WDN03_16460 [Rhizomicrobium sp.]
MWCAGFRSICRRPLRRAVPAGTAAARLLASPLLAMTDFNCLSVPIPSVLVARIETVHKLLAAVALPISAAYIALLSVRLA